MGARIPRNFSGGGQNGFDVIIGNPPYIRNTELSEVDKEFFNKNYESAFKQYDIFVLFFELGLRLLKEGGYLGFITSNKFLASDYGQRTRNLILRKSKIISLVDVSHLRVFKDASTYPVIIILQKETKEKSLSNHEIGFKRIDDPLDLSSGSIVSIKQSKFYGEDNRFLEDKGTDKYSLISKIEKSNMKISDLFVCQRGSPKNKIKVIGEKSNDTRICVSSRDVGKFYASTSKQFVVSTLQDKILSKEKILLPRTVLDVRAAFEQGGRFIMDRIYYLLPKEGKKLNLKYITGILNSKVIDFYYKTNFGSTHVGGGYLDLRGTQIVNIPIKIVDEANQKKIAMLVDRAIVLRKRLEEIGDRRTDERVKLEEELNRVGSQINNIVYTIYGITPAEQKTIEESLGE